MSAEPDRRDRARAAADQHRRRPATRARRSPRPAPGAPITDDLEHDRDQRVGRRALLRVVDEHAPQRAHRGRQLGERRSRRPARRRRPARPCSRRPRRPRPARSAPAGARPRPSRSTRVWPSRSISRPCATAPNALARPNAPTTTPARWRTSRVVSRASSRIASPNMPIGIEPSVESTSGARAPGRRSSARVAAQALQGAPSSVSSARLRSGPPP